MNRPLRVALSAGHHNRDGGNATEYAIVGELTEAYYREFRRVGCDVRVITPDGPDPDRDPGDGDFPGGLQDVARQVVNWANAGWVADLYLEVHTEGAGGVRGVFAIYPDWGGDLDTDVRDRLGPAVVRAISQATGLPVRGSGVMSERATGVGRQGYRLGIFYVTSPLRATTTRLIIEHGAHDAPADLAIMRSAGFNEKVAKAAVAEICRVFEVPMSSATTQNVITVKETGQPLGHGFKQLWEQLRDAIPQGHLRVLGYPLTPEFQIPNIPATFQIFERAILKYDPAASEPWKVHVCAAADEWIREWATNRRLGVLRPTT